MAISEETNVNYCLSAFKPFPITLLFFSKDRITVTRTNFYYNPSILQVLTEREIDNKLLVVPEKDHFNLITELYDPTDTLTKVSYAHL